MPQYTGGTIGVVKGAIPIHHDLIANILWCEAPVGTDLNEGRKILTASLPLCHTYVFTSCCTAMMLTGNYNILATNPCDLPLVLRDFDQ